MIYIINGKKWKENLSWCVFKLYMKNLEVDHAFAFSLKDFRYWLPFSTFGSFLSCFSAALGSFKAPLTFLQFSRVFELRSAVCASRLVFFGISGKYIIKILKSLLRIHGKFKKNSRFICIEWDISSCELCNKDHPEKSVFRGGFATFWNQAWNSAKMWVTALKFDISVAFMESNMELWRNGGKTTATAENRYLPPIFFAISSRIRHF